jgi:hypothetical protein
MSMTTMRMGWARNLIVSQIIYRAKNLFLIERISVGLKVPRYMLDLL